MYVGSISILQLATLGVTVTGGGAGNLPLSCSHILRQISHPFISVLLLLTLAEGTTPLVFVGAHISCRHIGLDLTGPKF